MKNISFSKIFFISLLVSATLSLSAQKDQIDSLKKLLPVTTQDTTRINILLALAEIVEPEELANVNKQSRELVQKHYGKENSRLNKLYQKYNGLVMGNEGVLMAQMGEYDKAITKINEAVKELRKVDHKKGITGLNISLSQMYQAKFEFNEALVRLQECLCDYSALKDTSMIGFTYRLIGTCYSLRGDVIGSIDAFNKSLAIFLPLNDRRNLIEVYRSLSYSYQDVGAYVKAADNILLCIELAEKLEDGKECALAYNDLAYILSKQDEAEKALEYYKKSLELSTKAKDYGAQATTLNNIALLYKAEKNYRSALEYFKKALGLLDKENNLYVRVAVLHNLSMVYSYMDDFATSLDYAEQALKIVEEKKLKKNLPGLLTQIGSIYVSTGKEELAEKYFLRAMDLAKKSGNPELISNVALHLKALYQVKKPAEALKMFELYVIMRDSVNNDATKKAASHAQLKYEFGVKSVADSLRSSEEKKVLALEVAKEKQQLIYVYCGLGLVLIFSGIMYNRFKLTKRQKHIIELQKEIVEEKQKEIVDSIRYARRIQLAQIPSEKQVYRSLERLRDKKS
jgi:tetratricopeptide (TPR) repeat protein